MNEQVSFGIALLAGFVSFASPCVLPLVPSYLSFVAGGVPKDKSAASQLRAFWRTCFFVLGFGIVFALLGAIFAGGGLALGSSLTWIRIAAGAVVIFFGINTIFDLVPFLNYQARAEVRTKPVNALGALVVGMAFGAGWTPCIGPILASILFMAGSATDLGQGAVYLTAYTVGLGVPFLVLSIALDRFRPVLAWMKKNAGAIKIASGIMLVALGGLIAFGQLAALVRASVIAGNQIQNWTIQSPVAAQTVATIVYLATGFLPLLLWWTKGRNHGKGPSAQTPLPAAAAEPHAPAATVIASRALPRLRLIIAAIFLTLTIAEWLAGPLLCKAIGTWLSFQGI